MKFNSAYPSLLGGVSQRPQGLRRLDQHTEQVNMIADPVRGLTRRQGSRALAWAPRATTSVPATLADADGFETIDLKVAATDISVAYRRATQPAGSALNVVEAFDKSTGALVPVVLKPGDADVALLAAGGVSAAVALGRFLLLAGNTMLPTYIRSDAWAPANNQRHFTVWVRGGAYSRSFAFALIRGNQKFWITYTTRSASYPDTLDTSDLLPTDPDYTKKVNDRTNEYNSRALAWAGDALTDATPENVAARLADELRASGFLSPGGAVTVSGSTVCITDESAEEVEVSDGGDGTLMRCAGNVVGAPELLTTIGFPGKVVKVRPTGELTSAEFYLRAVAKDKSTGSYTAVTWEEAPGVLFSVTRAFAFGTVDNGSLYISTDRAWLKTQTGVEFPAYRSSVTGDDTSAPPPEFLKNARITMLGVFQDRLIIGAGNAINSSRPGDYLNFFPASLLEVDDTDPVSFGIIGGEDDTLRRSLIYDRSLILVGDKRQYVVNGRVPFTPASAGGTVFAHLPDTGGVQPIASGNFLFCAKSGGGSVSLQQLQHGQIEESPFVQELTQDVDSYIAGRARSLAASATPDMVFLRADARNSLYVYQYRDVGPKRELSAWGRWDMASPAGASSGIVSIAVHDESLMLLRYINAASPYMVVEQIALTGAIPAHPYLDLATQAVAPSGLYSAALGAYSAEGSATNYHGCRMDVAASPIGWLGYLMTGYATLTSPHMPTKEGVGMLNGEMTVGVVRAELADSAGVVYRVGHRHDPVLTVAYGGQPGALIEGYDPQVGECLCDGAGVVLSPPDVPYPEPLPTDPYWGSTQLVAPLDDSLSDYSPANKTISLHGGGALTSTRSRFGTYAYENTSADPASSFRVSGLNYSTLGTLVVELDAYFTTIAATQTLFYIPGHCRLWYDAAGGRLVFTALGFDRATSYTPTLNAWTNLAFICRGWDGVNHSFYMWSNGVALLGGSGAAFIGSFSNVAGWFGSDGASPFIGGLSQARITVTPEPYTNRLLTASTYTPPPMALPRGIHAQLLNIGATGPKATTLTGIATPSDTDYATAPRSVYIPRRADGNVTDNGIVVDAHSDFAFGSNDFRIRVKFKRLINYSGTQARIFTAGVTGGTFRAYLSSATPNIKLQVEWCSSAGIQYSDGVDCPSGAWHTLELRRTGTLLEALLDSNVVDSRAINGGAASTVNCTGPLYFGRDATASVNPLNGYIDDIEVWNNGILVADTSPAPQGPPTPGSPCYAVASIDFTTRTVVPDVGNAAFPIRLPDPGLDPALLVTAGTSVSSTVQAYGLGVPTTDPVTELRPRGDFAQATALRPVVNLYVPLPGGWFISAVSFTFGTSSGTTYPAGEAVFNVGPTTLTGARFRVHWPAWDSTLSPPPVTITREADFAPGFCLPPWPAIVPCGNPPVVEPAPFADPLPWGNVPPAHGVLLGDVPVDLDDYDLAEVDPTKAVVVGTRPRSRSRLVIPVAAGANDYTLTLASYLWTPMTLTGVEYDGQFFTRTRRL